MLEALAAGLPVVSTPTGAIAEMLGDGDTGHPRAERDPAAMAGAVAALLDDPGRAIGMARRARQAIAAYTWPQVRERWTAVYGAEVVMIPARLFRMGPAEIAGRSVQELRKRLDRRGLAAKPYPVLGVLGALAPDAALDAIRARVRAGDLDGARALLLERFLEAAPARFFEGAVSPDAPGELRRRTRAAEAALVGEARIGARRALRPPRLSRPLLRRSDRLAPRSGERQAGAPRALDRRRLPRRRSGGGQQGRSGSSTGTSGSSAWARRTG